MINTKEINKKRYKVLEVAEEVEHIVKWIKEYFSDGNIIHKAILGISGGKDSTIAAALLVRALGAENVIGVLMPNGTQSDINDSYRVCEALGIKSIEINIAPAVYAVYDCIGRGDCEISQIFTNTPARIRMVTLYNIAAIYNGRVVNTSNRSESYVGYCTKYGDLAGDLAILRNYTVREVLAIGDYLKEIPTDLIHKVPSDGMCGKSDEDNLGITYAEIDEYLLENRAPENITALMNIKNRHSRNLHKNQICLPAPFCRTSHWEDEEWHEKGAFEF